MKNMPETKALVQLRRVKQGFSRYINQNYGAKAKDCRTCQTVCCKDSSFVNVNITHLEALAIWQTLKNSSRVNQEKFLEIINRAKESIETYNLSELGDTFSQTYSCPLFEDGIGCLVHWKAKPAPCIQHGCYENWQDLPDTKVFAQVERRVEQLNNRVYNNQERLTYATIPVWLVKIAEEIQSKLNESNNESNSNSIEINFEQDKNEPD